MEILPHQTTVVFGNSGASGPSDIGLQDRLEFLPIFGADPQLSQLGRNTWISLLRAIPFLRLSGFSGLALFSRLTGLAWLSRLTGLLATLHRLHRLLGGFGQGLGSFLSCLGLLASRLGIGGLGSGLQSFRKRLSCSWDLIGVWLLTGCLFRLLSELLGGLLQGLGCVLKLLSSSFVLLSGVLTLPLLS